MSVRPPMRPIAPTSVADATPVISSETTSGTTVIRMAFTQSVPIGASASAASSNGLLPNAAMSAPMAIAAASATRTRVLSFIIGSWWNSQPSHHQIAAIDIERRPSDVTRRLGRGEANEVGDFQRGTKAWNRVARCQAVQQLWRRVLVRQLCIDHAGTHRVDGDPELSHLFRGRARQPQQPGF